jgi:hypothetical protein
MTRRRNRTKQSRDDGVERAIPDEMYSKQPRFKDARSFFYSVLGWVKKGETTEKPYKPRSMERDQWLRDFRRLEPHLVGVFNSAVTIDKNRGWSITGGRNQVIRATAILHGAEDGMGWRYYFGRGAAGWYGTDMGFVSENGREGDQGPLRALYNVDSARCELTGSRTAPLKYTPKSGGTFEWAPDDFFRVASLPADDEAYHGLGFCAVSRCVELAKLMVAVYEHDQEKLGARAPKGLLLIRGIGEEQWEKALEYREAKLDSKEREYYAGVSTLISPGPDDVDAKLIALSQLPDGFDLDKFTDLLMYGYALAFGYDPGEFWPVRYGALGRGKETEVQHRKATGKGGMDLTSSYQERLQQELPESVHFEFEQRDTEGEILDAELAGTIATWVAKLYEAGQFRGEPLLDRQQALSLLVDKGLVPEEWSIIEEDVEATDTEDVGRWLRVERQRVLTLPRVLRAIELWPNEPIVKYTYDPLRYPLGRQRVLWAMASDALRRRSWAVAKLERQAGTGDVLFESGDVTITEEDVARAIDEAGKRVGPEMVQLLEAPAMTQEEMVQLLEAPAMTQEEMDGLNRTKPFWQRLLG